MLIYADCTPRYRRDEAVTAADDRLNAALPRLPPIEDPAKGRDLNKQIILLDHRLGPHGGDDLFLRNDVASSLDQSGENVERSRPDRDRDEGTVVIAPEQPAAKAVEAKLLE
jgi:hypothetical protein